jgi:hypothetical protein
VIAVLFTYVPSTGQNFATPIDYGDNPIEQAWALKAGLENDWPGAIWSVGADDEARKARGDATMKSLIGYVPEF